MSVIKVNHTSEHAPKSKWFKPVDHLPELVGETKKIYEKLEEFQFDDEKLNLEISNLPILGPYEISNGMVYYG